MTTQRPLAPCGEPAPGRARADRGSAIVEFVFVAVIVMVPLLYLIAAVATVQRSRLSATNAAREVGRAIASAPAGTDLAELARSALRIALEGTEVPMSDVELRYVAPGASCDAMAIVPDVSAGSEFQVCVIRQLTLPAVPTVLAGRGIRVVGRYVVHVDEFRRHG